MFKSAHVISGLAAFAILGGASLAPAAETRSGRAIVNFTGGVQESIFIRTNDSPSTITEGGFQVVSGSTVGPFTIGAGDQDTFTVLFAGEVELARASVVSPNLNNDDVLEVQAQFVNNNTNAVTNMRPSTATDFAGNNDREAHAMQWAIRLGTGSWNFRIVARVVDRAPLDAVTAALDEWSLTVTRHN